MSQVFIALLRKTFAPFFSSTEPRPRPSALAEPNCPTPLVVALFATKYDGSTRTRLSIGFSEQFGKPS
jgi:hypothetical protein